MFTFLADNLVVKFEIDVRVAVPSCLGEPILVEFLETVHLVTGEVSYLLLSFSWGLGLGQLTYIYNMVAHSGHELDAEVAEDVDLYYLVLPEVARHERLDKIGNVVAGIPLVDVARGDDEVAGVVRVGHDAALVVDVVVGAVVGLDSHDRHQLAVGYVDLSVLSDVALGGLDKRARHEAFLYLSCPNLGDGLSQRKQALLLQSGLDFVAAYEAVGLGVGNLYVDLGTPASLVVKLVERGEGHEQIHAQGDIYHDEESSLQVES